MNGQVILRIRMYLSWQQDYGTTPLSERLPLIIASRTQAGDGAASPNLNTYSSPFHHTKTNIMNPTNTRFQAVPGTLFFLAAPLFFSSCTKAVNEAGITPSSQTVIGTKATTTAETTTGTYQLVWSDEFDGTAVNTANWNFETGGGGWGNNEQQYYKAENAMVTNGNLVITAKKERVKANAYTSARLTTQNKRQFTYGKMEARIKLPMGQGLWPAFWMLGSNFSTVSWPACGEIDIMEHINTEPTTYGTIHWDSNGYAQYGGSTTTTPADYHIYSIEWDSSSIKWFVDGVQFHEANILNNINSTEEFHKPFFFILNLAVGGNWPGQTIDTSKLPASMYVDYVRVYQLL